jgi:hypothetical protein
MDTERLTRKLLQKKQEIEKAEKYVMELEASENQLKKELKKKFDCSTPAEVKKKLKDWKQKEEELEEQLQDGMAQLENKME